MATNPYAFHYAGNGRSYTPGRQVSLGESFADAGNWLWGNVVQPIGYGVRHPIRTVRGVVTGTIHDFTHCNIHYLMSPSCGGSLLDLASLTPIGLAVKGARTLKLLHDLDEGAAVARDVRVASRLERRGSALRKSDAFHRSVSWVVDNPAARRFIIRGGDGIDRALYQIPGRVNGRSGVFEWIIDRSGGKPVITHQRFIPGGVVNGYPNQVVR